MKLDFTGQRVLVTGATRGIGAAIAAAFEERGASLVLTGTNQREIEDLNRQNDDAGRSHVRWLQADFSSASSTESLVGKISEMPPFHVLINNAGTNRINLIDEIHTDDVDLLLSINLRAPLLLCKAVSRGMKEMQYGRIVNIASIWSVITKPGRTVYAATKTGLAGMTRSVAVDLASQGILVNAVSPGFVETELTRASLSPEERENLAAQVPVRRFAAPDEIARIVLFLSSSLNSYLTGQNIVVDGGFSCI